MLRIITADLFKSCCGQCLRSLVSPCSLSLSLSISIKLMGMVPPQLTSHSTGLTVSLNNEKKQTKRCSSPCLCAETGHIDPVLIERYNTPGFVGCLSRVQFNGVAPLKYALRTVPQAQATPTAAQPDRPSAAASPVSYQGKLVESNCGSSPLTIPPMSAATDPWHLDNTGEDYRKMYLCS